MFPKGGPSTRCEWRENCPVFVGATGRSPVVLEKPGLLQRELAEKLTISRSTATRTLDGLQKKGLIMREASERDGRESALRPTTKANALKDKINTTSGEVTKRLKRKLGVVQFENIVAKLRGAHLTFK